MKNTMLFILIIAATIFSADKYSVPFSASDSMTAAQYNSNNDTAAAYFNKAVDTLNLNIPRYTQNTYTHDLIMPFLRLDSLRSNTDIDSISGKPTIDSIVTTQISVDEIRGNPDVDSISGHPIIDTVTTTVVTADSVYSSGGAVIGGTATVDSLSSTKGITATTGTFSSIVSADSITLNSNDFAIVYDATVPCSLFDGGTYRATDNGVFYRLGKLKFIILPALFGTISSSTSTFIHIPSQYWPVQSNAYKPTTIENNSTFEIGNIRTDPGSGGFRVTNSVTTYLTAGEGGIMPTSIVYY